MAYILQGVRGGVGATIRTTIDPVQPKGVTTPVVTPTGIVYVGPNLAKPVTTLPKINVGLKPQLSAFTEQAKTPWGLIAGVVGVIAVGAMVLGRRDAGRRDAASKEGA